ncbi:hypothetical protein LX36DRAFT_32066 [Colletotrichum falcatum]|nr:hypothetical protein LX36DRAFT_32066 [Colletotrichum falcatum]
MAARRYQVQNARTTNNPSYLECRLSVCSSTYAPSHPSPSFFAKIIGSTFLRRTRRTLCYPTESDIARMHTMTRLSCLATGASTSSCTRTPTLTHTILGSPQSRTDCRYGTFPTPTQPVD